MDGQRELDATDRRLLELLQDDGRTTHAALGRAVGLTAPAVLDRVRRLERDGVIRGYHARLDVGRVGYGLTVLVAITLDHHGEERIRAFRTAIAGIPQVVECHYVTGTADFVLKVVAHDVNDYQRLLMTDLSQVPGIARVESSVVLATFKDDAGVDLSAARPAQARAQDQA